MNWVLEADGIAHAYGALRVLTSAALRLEEGRVTALVGRNGCGKSTLLRIAAGWLRADLGTVSYLGERQTPPRLHRLAARGLFYLPDREILSPRLTLGAQLGDCARRFPGSRAVTEVADELGLAPLLDAQVASLSGGELRRAELALALVRRPLCLLADEPFRGLAPLDAELLSAVFRAAAARGTAVVVTGHEIHTVLAVADRVVWCSGGTTRPFSSPAAAEADWFFQAEFLGVADAGLA